MATIPVQKTWADSTIPTHTEFNTNIKDAVNFLLRPPRVIVRRSSNQTIPCESWTRVDWSTDDSDDPDGMYPGDHNSRIAIVTPGWYEVKVSARWESTPPNSFGGQNGARAIVAYVNSGGTIGGDFEIGSDRRRATDNISPNYGHGCQSFSGVCDLGVGDYIEVFAWQGHRVPWIFIDGGEPQDLALFHVPTDGAFSACQTVRFSAVWLGE